MAIQFTENQTRVLNARHHNVLVSAAAGSGKTAVLVERIIRMISEDDPPLDIDRLLVVTFTRAAAAEMRERIAKAISQRLAEHPQDRHLQRQETLLHRAQITTIDSFCTFLLRNNCSEIDLDPGFRQIDENEAALIRGEALGKYLEEQYAAAQDPHRTPAGAGSSTAAADGAASPDPAAGRLAAVAAVGAADGPDPAAGSAAGSEGDPVPGITPERFIACVEYFCPEGNDAALEKLICRLFDAASSHSWPEAWLEERKKDYLVRDGSELLRCGWYRQIFLDRLDTLQEIRRQYQVMLRICREPGGPDLYLETIEEEYGILFGRQIDEAADTASLRRRLLETFQYPFRSLPAIRKKADKERIDPDAKERVQKLRNSVKDYFRKSNEELSEAPALTVQRMQEMAGPLETLIDLTRGYMAAYQDAKRERNAVDFSDLEHYALKVLIDRAPDGTMTLRPAARSFREYYDEVLIDEYQDSNEVQELLLSAITGEPSAGFAGQQGDGFSAGSRHNNVSPVRFWQGGSSSSGEEKADAAPAAETEAFAGSYARFMVGDVKQSIYRFRNARPEIFQRKFDTYEMAGDGAETPLTERIDLDQNFRSRRQVLDAANGVCGQIMRREIGGVEYDAAAALKPGASYPDPVPERDGSDPYQAELLLVDGQKHARGDAEGGEAGGGAGSAGKTGRPDGGFGQADRTGKSDGAAQDYDAAADGPEDAEEADGLLEELKQMDAARREALAVAQRIHELVGVLLVYDRDTGEQHPARYRDIVILMRAASGRQDAYREIFEKEGIPLYLEYKGGYFSAGEVRTVLQLLNVIDNPRQDIPLYGVLSSYYGGFSQDEIAAIRAFGSRAQRDSDETVIGQSGVEDGKLCDSLRLAAQFNAPDETLFSWELGEKCARFLAKLDEWRELSRTMTVRELIGHLVRSTGYEDYVRALPAGQRRAANLKSLLIKADAFEKSDRAGLFRFLRYIEQMQTFDVDDGEASVIDEHADVVRLTTIHKSKGLEYPICIVSGLGSKFAFKRDTSGVLITDADLGIGASYMNTALRCRAKTLRQMAVAEKLERESLGEELRVLYVAMTRAKEKLILTGYRDDAAGLLKDVEQKMAAADRSALHLPASLIRGSGNYLTLVLESMAMLREKGQEPIRLRTIPVTDLRLAELEDQMTLGELQNALLLTEQGDLAQLPSPETAQRLTRQFAWRYPYETPAGLYTKTTVTELKRAAMAGDGRLEDAGEPPAEMYPEETYQDFGIGETEEIRDVRETGPYNDSEPERKDAGAASVSAGGGASAMEDELPVPRFAAEAPEEAGTFSGAGRGTAVHRMCELIDYRVWSDPSAVTERMFTERVGALLGAGVVPPSYAPVLTARTFLPFLHSDIASRMAAADAKGLLVREQPFVLGIAANRLNPEFPEEETILIQGIIDAFFIEEGTGAGTDGAAVTEMTDAAGDDREERYCAGTGRHIVLVDYKTDRVKTGQELIDRYRVQIEYYAEALGRMLRLPVTERILYSFALQEEIHVRPVE